MMDMSERNKGDVEWLIYYLTMETDQKRKKTRQGNGRGTKFSTRMNSKRFKKKTRGQGKK